MSSFFTQNAYSQTYCTSKGNLPWQEWISNVTFGTINNTSNKEGYGNFTTQTTNVTLGQTYSISITQGFSWAADPINTTQQGRVWIDFNKNNTFEDIEMVAAFNRTNTIGNVYIPINAILGNTRMRVSLKTIGVPTSCEIFDKGEVEDYTINIVGATGTPNLVINNVTGPAYARPAETITLNVSITNTGTGASIPTKLQYRQLLYNQGFTRELTLNTVQIAPILPNETRLIPYTLTLTNPIYPPNALYLYDSQTFANYAFTDYYVMLTNRENDQAAYILDPKFKFNINMIFPQADIGLTITPNKTTIADNEAWNAVYTIKNNGPNLVKQVFINIGSFANFGRNYSSGMYAVDSVKNLSTNSAVKVVGGEILRYGWEVLDLNPYETKTLTLHFSPIVNRYQTGTQSTILPYPYVDPLSNVIDTTGDNSRAIEILYNVPVNSNLPDLTMANLNLTTPSVKQGEILYYKFDLKNIGRGNATGNFNVRAYISTNNILNAGVIQDGLIQTANYAAGFTTFQVPGASRIPNTLSVGQYYLILQVDGENFIPESSEVNNTIVSVPFTITENNRPYCVSKSNAPWEYWISRVQFNSINYVSDKFKDYNTLGYSNYTNIVIPVSKNQTYPLSITPSLSWIGNLPNTFCRVWIDFNQNNTFEDTELVLQKTNLNTFTQNVFIPNNALIGNTRMRVSVKSGIYPLTCETFSSGEVEDYTINIINGTQIQPLIVQSHLKLNILDNKIRLEWIKMSDKIKHFDVEKSVNGIDFTFMHTINVYPTENYYYTYDENIIEGDNFYRIKTNLVNNTSIYSNIEHINYKELSNFSLFPNPATEEVFINVKEFENKEINITLLNSIGAIIKKETINKVNTQIYRIDLTNLQSGIYFINIESKGKRTVVRKISVL